MIDQSTLMPGDEGWVHPWQRPPTYTLTSPQEVDEAQSKQTQIDEQAREAAAIILKRREALTSIENYRQYISQSGHSDFQHPPAPHHQVITKALEMLVAHQLLSSTTGQPVRRLLITAPPGSAKSTYGSIQFATWYLAKNPSHSVLTCSSTQELAETFNRRRRETIRTHEWTQLCDQQINPNEQGVGKFSILPATGSIKASGVGSSIVGNRSHLNILDDPIASFEEAASQQQLEKMWNWYATEYRSRLIPTGLEVVITTRWAKNDPAGKILKLVQEGLEDWHVIRLPMLCDDPDTDPLNREIGEPLWPEWFGSHQIVENQRDPLRWTGMYQQLPMDAEGTWVPPENIKLISIEELNAVRDSCKGGFRIIQAMDLAMSIGKGDYSVIGTAGIDTKGNIYIIDWWRDRVTPDVLVSALSTQAKIHSPSVVVIDDDPAAKTFLSLFHGLQRRTGGHPIPLLPRPTRGRDKEMRAAAIRGYFMQGVVYILNTHWTPELIREINVFPSSAPGDHDDQIDVLSLIGREVRLAGQPIGADGPKPPPFQERIGHIDGRMYLLEDTLDSLFKDKEGSDRKYLKLRL